MFNELISCYGSTSKNSSFTFLGYIDKSLNFTNIKKEISTLFNIPEGFITGLYKKNIAFYSSYNNLDYFCGNDLYITYLTYNFIYNLETKNNQLSSNISNLQRQCNSLESTNRELNSNYSNLQYQYNSLVNRNRNNEQKINDLNNEIQKQNEISEKKKNLKI